MVASSIGPRRTEIDFAAHITQTISTDPDATWIFVVDQLNTHKSETLVRLVADLCNINTDLGKKGKDGILESMATRAEFLCDVAIGFVLSTRPNTVLGSIRLRSGSVS
jgi:hypothetical protein